MPLQQFQILGLHAIKRVVCDKVPDLMIIAGPNGVGKSTLLEAISKMLNGQQMGNVSINSQGTPKPVYIPPHRAPFPTSLSKSLIMVQPSSSFRDTLRRDSYAIHDPMNQTHHIMRTGLARSRFYPDMATIFEVKNKIAQMIIRKNETIAATYEKNKQIPFESIPDFYQPIRDMVEYLLPGIVFQDVKIENEVYSVNFKNRLGQTVEFDGLSSGEKETIAMLFPIVEQQIESIIAKVKGESPLIDDLVILLDSPESHLHPSLQYLFVKFIRDAIEKSKAQKQNLQFIISTHSPMIINEATNEELFLMQYPNNDENQLLKTSDFDLYKLQEYLGQLGLSAFTFGKPILLVEGKDDEDVLRLLYPEIEKKFVLYNLGGKERVTGFIEAFNQVIQDLSSRGMKIVGILDKDRENLVNKSSTQTQDSLFVLSVTCMENVLLSSECIYESLKFLAGPTKLSSTGINSSADIDSLKNAVVNSADFYLQEMKTRLNEQLSFYVSIDSLSAIDSQSLISCVDSFTADRKKKVTDILANQEIKVKDAIKHKNFGELNGKIILTKIAEGFGLKRDVLARTIAVKMRENNSIPKEIDDIVTKITASH